MALPLSPQQVSSSACCITSVNALLLQLGAIAMREQIPVRFIV